MYNECIICSENVKIKKKNNYLFYQSCDCFLNNIHDECFVQWIDKKGTCLICHKPIYYEKIYKPFVETREKKSFIKKIFNCLCCK